MQFGGFYVTRSVVLTAIVVLGLIGTMIFVVSTYFQTDPLTIVRTNDEFEPSEIEIELGDTVTFVNESDEPMWPAANSHPTHNSLSDFDPLEPIAPGGSWTYTFNAPGEWGFHDHVRPGFRGVITAGDPSDAPKDCDDPSLDINSRVYCWGITGRDIARAEGFEAVFNWLGEQYSSNTVFRNNCHDVTHIIGEVAYEAYDDHGETVIRPETSYCGYGFYHGFIEVALASFGAGYEERAREYCDMIGEDDSFPSQYTAETARSACDHGIGHAVFDSINSTYWGDALQMANIGYAACGRMYADDDWRRIMCGSGISNATAKAYEYERYNLAFDERDPTQVVCANIAREHQNYCYLELGLHYRGNQGFSAKETLAYFSNFPKGDIGADAIAAFVDDEIRYRGAIDRLPYIHDICTSFEDELYEETCVRGVMIGLRTGGEPGSEHEKMVEFCSLYETGSDKYDHCAMEMFSKMLTVYDKERYTSACVDITPNVDEQYVDMCREFAGRI